MKKRTLGAIALILAIVIVGGLLWLAIQSSNAAGALLSYAAGLSMIFLPCTLPLAFVIVPLAAKEESAGRGVGLAVAFGLGLAVTLTLYGILTAVLGDFFGLDAITRTMFVVAGIMALGFGLTELGLLHIPLPTFTHHVPNWIDEGYGKTFLLGVFLGNAGVGCPNPAFYILLTYIASVGDVVTGGWLGFVHGLGRATPLIFLVVLALIGIKSTDYLKSVSNRLSVWTGAALVAVGSFILTYGLFGMHWWEDSIFHASWNRLVYIISPNLAEAPNHPVAQGVFEVPSEIGWISLIAFIFIPFIWYALKKGVERSKSWTISIILGILLVMSFTGLIEVEHGHGTEASDRHNDASSEETQEKHPLHEHQ